MTRLLDDLTAIAARHSNQHPDIAVPVPIGAVRAAITMLRRYEGFSMQDRINEVPVVPQVGRSWQRKGWREHA